MSEEVRERLEAAKLSDDPVAPPAPFDEVDAIIQTYVDTAAVPGDEDRVNRSREAMIRTIVTTFVDEQGLRGKVARKEVTGAECHEMIRDHIIAFLSAGQSMPPAEPDASLRVACDKPVCLLFPKGQYPPFEDECEPTSDEPPASTLAAVNSFLSGPPAPAADREDPSKAAFQDGYVEPIATLEVFDGSLCLTFPTLEQARHWCGKMNSRVFAGEAAAFMYTQNMGDYKHFRLPQTLMHFMTYVAIQKVVADDGGAGLRVAYGDKVGHYEAGFGRERFSAWVARCVARFKGDVYETAKDPNKPSGLPPGETCAQKELYDEAKKATAE